MPAPWRPAPRAVAPPSSRSPWRARSTTGPRTALTSSRRARRPVPPRAGRRPKRPHRTCVTARPPRRSWRTSRVVRHLLLVGLRDDPKPQALQSPDGPVDLPSTTAGPTAPSSTEPSSTEPSAGTPSSAPWTASRAGRAPCRATGGGLGCSWNKCTNDHRQPNPSVTATATAYRSLQLYAVCADSPIGREKASGEPGWRPHPDGPAAASARAVPARPPRNRPAARAPVDIAADRLDTVRWASSGRRRMCARWTVLWRPRWTARHGMRIRSVWGAKGWRWATRHTKV